MVSPHRKIFALKRIRLSGHDKESAQGFVDEIHLLRQLQGKENIIQLIDAEVSTSRQPASHSLSMRACSGGCSDVVCP